MNQPSQIDVQQIADKGNAIYEDIKMKYEPNHTGDFLAIDTETEEVFLGKTNSQAVEAAKEKYPQKVFYVVRIGHSATETLASMTRA